MRLSGLERRKGNLMAKDILGILEYSKHPGTL
jgi:hypothetical protein